MYIFCFLLTLRPLAKLSQSRKELFGSLLKYTPIQKHGPVKSALTIIKMLCVSITKCQITHEGSVHQDRHFHQYYPIAKVIKP